MKKMLRHGMLSALAAVLVWAAFCAPAASSQRREGGIASAAKIYGYDLGAGNWTLDQVHCVAMPKVSLLHYREAFHDGAESRFTAVVPLEGEGPVRIVPVLHRNATPFLPAPVNPRNYALFNELVQGTAAKGTWLDLSACYAALTGAGSGVRSELGIAGAPRPTVHTDPGGKTHRVTFATRQGESGYKVWNVSFDRFGRVMNATTEDESVYAGKAPSPRKKPEPAVAAKAKPAPKIDRKQREHAVYAEAAREIHQETAEAAPRIGSTPQENAEKTSEAATSTPAPENPPQQQPSSSDEVGWKFIPTPPDPPSKIIPEPRQPSEAPLPNRS
ncbi:MAG TPA: hypothetical protein VFL96_01945 [Acidobacteriaceae bacterium]|nr:hypothetical protein [Acidobacteriaceae bacterium]